MRSDWKNITSWQVEAQDFFRSTVYFLLAKPQIKRNRNRQLWAATHSMRSHINMILNVALSWCLWLGKEVNPPLQLLENSLKNELKTEKDHMTIRITWISLVELVGQITLVGTLSKRLLCFKEAKGSPSPGLFLIHKSTWREIKTVKLRFIHTHRTPILQ